MTDYTRNPDGDAFDIEFDEPEPRSGGFTFKLGDTVSPDDRGNIGEVVLVEPQRVQARFVDKHNGRVSDLFFAPSALKLVRRHSEPRVIELITFQELINLPYSEWLVEDVLRMHELACLFGPPASYKTFIALDMALRIALGIDWYGHATKSRKVVYLAAEGLYAVQARAKAWIQQFPNRDELELLLQENFLVIGEAVSVIEPEFEQLLDVLTKLSVKPDLFIIDTLARCMVGGDENNSKDMGKAVHACDRLRKATQAAVLLVHHTPKDRPRSERGSSALRGACDAMYSVAPVDGRKGVVLLVCEKQKEGEHFPDLDFALDVVEVGVMHNGKVRTSARIVRAGVDTRAKSDSDLREQDPEAAIQETLAKSFFDDGASGTELRETTRLKKQTFHRALHDLVDEGVVDRVGLRGHYRYQLTPKSSFYRPPPPPPPEPDAGSSPSPSPASPTNSNETGSSKSVESQSQSHAPPLGGAGTETGTRTTDDSSPQHQRKKEKPRAAAPKKKTRSVKAEGAPAPEADDAV